MILTGPEIVRAHEKGTVAISLFSRRQVNPNSYDYRLAPELIELAPAGADTVRVGDESEEPVAVATRTRHVIGDDGFVLRPGRLYLGRTLESLGSDTYVTTLIGKSSMGRLGLFLQVDACLGHQGVDHHWTLELCVRQPLRVYAAQVIGQVSFWTAEGERTPYRGKYGILNDPSPNDAPTFVGRLHDPHGA